MPLEPLGQIIQSIGRNFDANSNGTLEGAERSAFFREVIRRLGEHNARTGTAATEGPPANTLATLRHTETPEVLAVNRPDERSHGTDLNHITDFLTLRADDGRVLYTHLYVGYSDADRGAVRQALQERGYTHIYVYAMNEGDYGGRAVFDAYGDPSGFRDALQELVDDGLAPVVWLAPDDAPRFHEQSAQTLPSTWDRVIPMFDDLVSSYVVGLEMDEYWTADEQDRLGQHLDGLTKRPLFVHYTPGEWEGAKSGWVDGLIYQYGFGLSEEAVAERTSQLVSRLHGMGKTFIAGEYAHRIPESYARKLGAAALRSGADGVGNGAYL